MISVDTNILIYAANPAAARHANSLRFMRGFNDKELVLCELVLVELYMALRNPAVFPSPYSSSQAVDYCRKLKTHPNWRYVDYEPAVASKLWDWAQTTRHGFRQIIDARIALTLIHHDVDTLATANTRDFSDFGFSKVWDPYSPDSK